jgi:hypothetical protein
LAANSRNSAARSRYRLVLSGSSDITDRSGSLNLPSRNLRRLLQGSTLGSCPPRTAPQDGFGDTRFLLEKQPLPTYGGEYIRRYGDDSDRGGKVRDLQLMHRQLPKVP